MQDLLSQLIFISTISGEIAAEVLATLFEPGWIVSERAPRSAGGNSLPTMHR
jgi:hypothetical protein